MPITHLIGTGGIGTGVFYRLEDNRTLGRDESRPAHRLARRDYCKQHIVLHYLAVLLRDLEPRARVIPIGAVGDDPAGRTLCEEMAAAGLALGHVETRRNAPTLSAVCYVFPDGSGGNLTESRSACGKVTARAVSRAWAAIRPPAGGRTLALALPEVPLPARRELLRRARRAGAYTAASFVPQEIPDVKKGNTLSLLDLLAVNRDEAAALAGCPADRPPADLAEACRQALCRRYPRLDLVVTAGRDGAWGLTAEDRLHLPALKVPVRNTAGAGDAFLSGVVLGKVLGLPFLAPEGSALHLGRALAGLKVRAEDTIDFGISLQSLRAFLRKQGETALLRALA